jgi:hypothetical protein
MKATIFFVLIIISANSFAGLTRIQPISELLMENYFKDQCFVDQREFGYSLIIDDKKVILRCYAYVVADDNKYRVVMKDIFLTTLIEFQINLNDVEKYVDELVNALQVGDVTVM